MLAIYLHKIFIKQKVARNMHLLKSD